MSYITFSEERKTGFLIDKDCPECHGPCLGLVPKQIGKEQLAWWPMVCFFCGKISLQNIKPSEATLAVCDSDDVEWYKIMTNIFANTMRTEEYWDGDYEDMPLQRVGNGYIWKSTTDRCSIR